MSRARRAALIRQIKRLNSEIENRLANIPKDSPLQEIARERIERVEELKRELDGMDR